MATFGAIGALALLDPSAVNAEPADAAKPLAVEDARSPLRSGPAPGVVEALGPPAATDAAFRAAIAALASPFEAAQDSVGPSLGEQGAANATQATAMAPDAGDPRDADAGFAIGDDNALPPVLANDTLTPLPGLKPGAPVASGLGSPPSTPIGAGADALAIVASGVEPSFAANALGAFGHEAAAGSALNVPQASTIRSGALVDEVLLAGGLPGWVDVTVLLGDGTRAAFFVENEGLPSSAAGPSVAAVNEGLLRVR